MALRIVVTSLMMLNRVRSTCAGQLLFELKEIRAAAERVEVRVFADVWAVVVTGLDRLSQQGDGTGGVALGKDRIASHRAGRQSVDAGTVVEGFTILGPTAGKVV